MEVAGVVLGVVPIVLEALKAWRLISNKLRIFRTYAKAVRRVCDNVRVQNCIFENELQALLVAAGLNADLAQDMISDSMHYRWTEPATENNIAAQLGKDQEVYTELVQSVSDSLCAIQSELRSFDHLAKQKGQDERLKDAILRLRSAVKITFNVSAYEKQIESLRSSDADLRVIGTYRKQLAPRQSSLRNTASQPPQELDQIHRASKALHRTLDDVWCCTNASHTEHAAKLCLQARVENGVRLELAMSCSKRQVNQGGPCNDAPLWLYVRSITEVGPAQTSCHPAVSSLLAARQSGQSPQKRAKVQTKPSAVHISGTDLRKSVSFCDSLSLCHCLTDSEECLGYLESSEPSVKQLKHLFYHRCKPKTSVSTSALEIGMPELLEQSRGSTGLLSVEDQLRLAYTLAMSLLHLYATPWLANDWRLRDVSIFQLSGQALTDALSSAHVTTTFPNKAGARQACDVGAQSLSRNDGCQDSAEEQLLYGVPNLALFSLGIALLEIGQKQSLESLRMPRDQNNILTARRMAQRPSILGQRYQMIARRCLQCDFGFGSDLDKPKLQTAVYNDVVCQLGDMLEAFKI